jgi:hypothetical protein
MTTMGISYSERILHANQPHHSAILVFQKMAMIGNVPTVFGSRKSIRNLTLGYTSMLSL